MKNYESILKLKGLRFIEALLAFEEQRFDKNFLKGSVYEEINKDFGIFPAEKAYPVYFCGDVTKPKNKIIFIGINPGYSSDRYKEEGSFLKKNGLFWGYCNLYGQWQKEEKSSRGYYSGIRSFLRKFYGWENESMNWSWFQENFISLEFIPYHTISSGGLEINDPERYRDRYFSALIKILNHLRPENPIFINGFSGFAEHFNEHKKVFKDMIVIEKKYKGLWFGKIDGKFNFIGLPFLTRIAGGQKRLIRRIHKKMPKAFKIKRPQL